MILTKEARDKLQKVIHNELLKIDGKSQNKDIFLIISALISDFEELEKRLCDICITLASGKEINELLDHLSRLLPLELIDNLEQKEQLMLIKNLSLLANNAQKLKELLAGLHDKKYDVVQ